MKGLGGPGKGGTFLARGARAVFGRLEGEIANFFIMKIAKKGAEKGRKGWVKGSKCLDFRQKSEQILNFFIIERSVGPLTACYATRYANRA